MKSLQKFTSLHAKVHNHFNLERKLIDRETCFPRRLRVAETHDLRRRGEMEIFADQGEVATRLTFLSFPWSLQLAAELEMDIGAKQ